MTSKRAGTGGTTGTNQHKIKGASAKKDRKGGGSKASVKRLAETSVGSEKAKTSSRDPGSKAISNSILLPTALQPEKYGSKKMVAANRTVFVSSTMVTNTFFAIKSNHPRFDKTVAKLGGIPTETASGEGRTPLRRYDGKPSNFKGADSMFESDAAPGFPDVDELSVKETNGQKMLRMPDVALDPGPAITGGVESYGQKETVKRLSHLIQQADGSMIGIQDDYVKELAGDGIEVRPPLMTYGGYRLVDSESDELVGLIMSVRIDGDHGKDALASQGSTLDDIPRASNR